MDRINFKRFGLALGFTGSLIYLACALIMLLLGHDGTVKFFNIQIHGADVSALIRMNMSPAEALVGIVQTSIIFGLLEPPLPVFTM